MINLGLKRTTRLLQHIGRELFNQSSFDPPWKAVHIAGTNGKGSVAAYLSALLQRTIRHKDGSAIRVGRFTSPHFIDRWDCIRINDEAVSQELFESTEKQIKAIGAVVSKELVEQAADLGEDHNDAISQAQRHAELTEFELLTATAFTIFSQAQPRPCDITVIECGLGGRLDATNALPDSVIGISVITRIGLDHVDILGGSIRSIVHEKCGIFRDGAEVIVDEDNSSEVLAAIHEEVLEKYSNDELEGSREDRLDDALCHVRHAKGTHIDHYIEKWQEKGKSNAKLQLSVTAPSLMNLVPHQKSNLALAFEVWNVLHEDHAMHADNAILKGLDFCTYPESSPDCIEKVLQDATQSYPARLQMLEGEWLRQADKAESEFGNVGAASVLLDGAHNEQSAAVLRDYVDRYTGHATDQPATRPANEVVDDEVTSLGHQGADASGSDAVTVHLRSSDRQIIWILALSSTKPPTEILRTLFPPRFRQEHDAAIQPKESVIFTTFSPVDGMPWVKLTPVAILREAAESLDLEVSIQSKSGASNIVEALQQAETILSTHKGAPETRPLIVVAGSLYLASDFLRLQRDGIEKFLQYWGEVHRPTA